VKVTSQFPEEVCFMATKSRFYSRQQDTKICLYKTKVASVKKLAHESAVNPSSCNKTTIDNILMEVVVSHTMIIIGHPGLTCNKIN
jgi:hypothetical protein